MELRAFPCDNILSNSLNHIVDIELTYSDLDINFKINELHFLIL